LQQCIFFSLEFSADNFRVRPPTFYKMEKLVQLDSQTFKPDLNKFGVGGERGCTDRDKVKHGIFMCSRAISYCIFTQGKSSTFIFISKNKKQSSTQLLTLIYLITPWYINVYGYEVRTTRCVTKQTELPKYNKIRDSYEKTLFLKIVALYISNKFCFNNFAEKSLWISAYGMENGLLVLPTPKNDSTSFVLSLPKPFTRHWGTKMIMEFMEDVNSYEKLWVNMFWSF
jgi:hypothetical protein